MRRKGSDANRQDISSEKIGETPQSFVEDNPFQGASKPSEWSFLKVV
jgi:hypothetical protein